MDNIRIGKVSSVDPAKATVSVTYEDTGDTTSNIPYFAFNDEYKMPEKEQVVLVLHLSNGGAAGVVLGRFWTENKPPTKTGVGLMYKDMGGGAYLESAGGAVTLKGSGVTLSGAGTITVDEIIAKLDDHEARITALGG